MKTKSTNSSPIVLENGGQLDVSVTAAARLVADDLIYLCPDCGVEIYHVNPFVDVTLDDIENRLRD